MISQNLLTQEQPAFPWASPAERLTLRNGDVHVWAASLVTSHSRAMSLRMLLSTEEQHRADRFRFSRDSDRFIISRALLRIILSRYTNIEPKAIEFSYNERGKPSLAVPLDSGLSVSLSRAEGFALFAVGAGTEVGVDIERLVSDLEVDGIAERFFSPPASSRIRMLRGIEKREAFFRYWVSKEAYAKATGDGLSLALNREFSSATARKAAREKYSRWSLQQIDVHPDYRAALVTDSGCGAITCYWAGEGLQEW